MEGLFCPERVLIKLGAILEFLSQVCILRVHQQPLYVTQSLIREPVPSRHYEQDPIACFHGASNPAEGCDTSF